MTPNGGDGSATVEVSCPETGLSADTVLAAASATQTDPPPEAIPVGSVPTLTVWTTWLASALMRDTVPARVLATQMSGPAAVIALGPAPTGMVCVIEAVSGSIR